MTTVLKLGGSVVTEKGSERTVSDERLDTIVATIARADRRGYLLVIGGGSFGHPAADRHGMSEQTGSSDPRAMAEVHDAMLALTSIVIDRLVDAGVPAVAIHPLSMAHREDGDLHLSFDPVEQAVSEGYVPVLHGDCVLTAGQGATILSGDEIAVELARHFDADRVGLCTGVPGVLDSNEELIDRIEQYERVADVLGESTDTDVTGGMAGKVSTLLELGIPSSVFDIAALAAFLDGESPGTTIDSSS